MKHWTASKAILAGLATYAFGLAMSFCFSYDGLLRFVLLATPGFAAFVAAYFAPCQKIAIGMSMAVYGAVMSQLMNSAYEYLGGYVDHIGGMLVTFVILFSYYLVLSLIGSVAGYFLSRKVNDS